MFTNSGSPKEKCNLCAFYSERGVNFPSNYSAFFAVLHYFIQGSNKTDRFMGSFHALYK